MDDEVHGQDGTVQRLEWIYDQGSIKRTTQLEDIEEVSNEDISDSDDGLIEGSQVLTNNDTSYTGKQVTAAIEFLHELKLDEVLKGHRSYTQDEVTTAIKILSKRESDKVREAEVKSPMVTTNIIKGPEVAEQEQELELEQEQEQELERTKEVDTGGGGKKGDTEVVTIVGDALLVTEVSSSEARRNQEEKRRIKRSKRKKEKEKRKGEGMIPDKELLDMIDFVQNSDKLAVEEDNNESSDMAKDNPDPAGAGITDRDTKEAAKEDNNETRDTTEDNPVPAVAEIRATNENVVNMDIEKDFVEARLDRLEIVKPRKKEKRLIDIYNEREEKRERPGGMEW